VRRLITLICLLGAISVSGCTTWSEYGQGGAAEDFYNTPSNIEYGAAYQVSHELRQDLNYLRQHLDVLVLRGAQRCFPASVYTASLAENRVAREIAGGLSDDAGVSLLNLRIDLQNLEKKVDAVNNADSCWAQNSSSQVAETDQDDDKLMVDPIAKTPTKAELDLGHLYALLNSDNQFASGSYLINPKYRENLAMACTALVQEPAIGLRVTGHADASGNSRTNIALSSRRTSEVVSFLTSCGIAAGRIMLFFKGDTQPEFTGRSPEIDLVNRRVSIELDVDYNRS